MKDLKSKKLFLLDMDGTLYLDNKLFDGTIEFLNYVKNSGGRYIFLTNNSSKSVDKYVEKLSGLGIKADAEDFLTSTNATINHLKNKNYKCIYAFGTKFFKQQLEDEGLPITDVVTPGIDCLCMGFDTELTFKKLEDACILLRNDIDYIATNPDWVCPTWYGYVPDCGSVSEMLFRATKRRPVFIGKPQPAMLELAMEKTGFKREETVIIGDRMYTDIKSGYNTGVTTAFVLSGEGTLEDVSESDFKPDFIFRNILDLLNNLR